MHTYFPMSLGNVCNDTSLSAKWASVLSWVKPSGNLKQNTGEKLWTDTLVTQLIGSLQSRTLMRNNYLVWRSLFDPTSHGRPGICLWSEHSLGLKKQTQWLNQNDVQTVWVQLTAHVIWESNRIRKVNDKRHLNFSPFQRCRDEHSSGLFLWHLPG